MFYIVFVILIIIASFLLILAVLAQNPKGGMAANFGASNQVMGVRETSNFLEKSTWYLAVAIVILSLLASIAMSSHERGRRGPVDSLIEQVTGETGTIPNQIPVTPIEEGIQLDETSATPVGESVEDAAESAGEAAEDVAAPEN